MKKIYVKPEIIIEDFSLNMSIAGDCEAKTKLPSVDECGILFGSNMVFTTEVSGCDEEVEPSGDYNGFCYHNPSESQNVFYS